uniref:Uncharacterized protein n=1 Tax=Lactuca sativa TaxID=4236 RepID=A0A9R1VFK5_LACSA|nr:hypothetical protein LSAT_V11C500290940 [Lactuca sativa]
MMYFQLVKKIIQVALRSLMDSSVSLHVSSSLKGSNTVQKVAKSKPKHPSNEDDLLKQVVMSEPLHSAVICLNKHLIVTFSFNQTNHLKKLKTLETSPVMLSGFINRRG